MGQQPASAVAHCAGAHHFRDKEAVEAHIAFKFVEHDLFDQLVMLCISLNALTIADYLFVCIFCLEAAL